MQHWTSRLAILPLLAVASVSWGAPRTFDKQFTAPPGGKLVVDTADGSITIVGHDSRDLTVHADISGTEAYTVTAEQSDAGVTVQGRGHFRWYNVAFNYVSVHITIEVPRDYPVELKSSDGRLEISQINAGLHGKTSDGRITLRDITGDVDMQTSDGSITAENLKGSVRLQTKDGSIDVNHVAGQIEARTSDGHVDLQDVDGKITVHDKDGRVTVAARSNHGIAISASDGNVTLQLPGDIQGSITANAHGGRIRSDFPVTMTATEAPDRGYLSGQINGGGEAITIDASDGHITLSRL
jgi:DUF4097 and DUF4098 domain-containing protein YvlB